MKFKHIDLQRRPYDDKPYIDYCYDLIYINNDDIANSLGWLCFPYYLVDKNKIIGIENDGKNIGHSYIEKVKILFNYDVKEYLNKITKIGKIKITKIGKYKNDQICYKYSLHLDIHSFIKPVEINKNDIFINNKTFSEYLEQ